MGAYLPLAPLLDAEAWRGAQLVARAHPEALRARGIDYRGVIMAGGYCSPLDGLQGIDSIAVSA